MFSVLYVDDEIHLLDLGKMFLEKTGDFCVTTAETVDDGLSRLEHSHFDAVISDYQMPGKDGLVFLKEVRLRFGDIPFILFTGRSREIVVIEAINNGADFYVQKGGAPTPQFAELSHKLLQVIRRKQAEDELFSSRQMLRLVLDNIPEAVFWKDRNSVYLGANRPFASDTGFADDPAGLIGKTDLETSSAEIAESFRADDRSVMETGIPKLDYEEPQIKPDGSRAWIRTSKVPLRNQDGSVIGVLGTYQDITERKKAENELRASEERFRLLVEFLPIAVVVYREGKIIYANPEAIRLTGSRSPGDYMGKAVLSFIHPDYHALALEDRRAHEEGRPVPLKEMTLLTVSGKTFTVEMAATTFLYQHQPSVLVVFRDITERKQAEDTIRQERDFTRMSLDSLPGVFYVYDQQGRFLRWNKNLETITGYSGEEILHMNALDFFADKAVVLERMQEAFRTGEAMVEAHVITKDQNQIPMLLTAKRVELDGKNYLIGMGIDITERRRAEEAVVLSSAHLQRAELVAGLGHWEFDMGTNTVYASDGARTLYGMSGQTRTLTEVQDVPLPEYRPVLDAALRALIEDNKPYDVTFRVQRPTDGKILDIHSIAEYDPKTRVVFGVIQDITEQNKMQALRESEERFRALVEHSLDGTLILDLQGTVLFANNAITRTLELEDCAGLLDRNVMEFVAPESHNDAIHDFGEIARGHDAYLAQYKLITTKGNEIYVESIGKIISYKGKPADLLSIREITKRRQAEEALHEANRKLNILSSITRHDINNQLSALVGYLRILEKRQTDPTLTEYSLKVAAAARRISGMIRFAQEYEKIGVRAPVWLECRKTLDAVAKDAALGQVRPINDLPENMEIFADPLIVKVFYNLMDNAVQYGGKITTIRFSCEKQDEDQIIVCEDDGEGIVPDEKERIFERGVGKNTGLGLAISREILSITGITITETGEPVKGARFEMLVPERMWRMI